MKKNLLSLIALAAVSFTACKKNPVAVDTTVAYPGMAEAADPAVLFTTDAGVKVYNGGFGSAMAADPNDPNVFYLMTDRGPNVAGKESNTIIL
ncbi:hypothetical protein, partial [Mucilaginibacter sp.]|uniref:hypothetical protein n=1 Tax=Mucilaginibacter sp. TaxID=1882438 RepID=UPI000CC6DD62